MSTKFYDGKNIKIEQGLTSTTLNIFFTDRSKFFNVEPRLYFPLSDSRHFISIVKTIDDGNGKTKEEELFVINDINNLDEASRGIVEITLNRFYMISKILDIYESKKNANIVQWKVLTDKGECSLTIKDIFSSIKKLPDGRIFVVDSSDNKYEITDIDRIPAKGRKLILSYL